MDRIILKIYQNKKSGQLLLSIPKKSGLQDGDYVELKQIKEDQ